MCWGVGRGVGKYWESVLGCGGGQWRTQGGVSGVETPSFETELLFLK